MINLACKFTNNCLNSLRLEADFQELQQHAQQKLNKLLNNPKIAEIISSKNLYQTTQDRYTEEELAEHHLNAKQIKKLDFGSTALYLKEMRDATKALLKAEKWEPNNKRLLEEWLKATEFMLQISWCLDWSRVNIPGVLKKVLNGEDPTTNLITGLAAPFYTPSHSTLTTMAGAILEKWKNLKYGECFALPSGYFSHETILVVEKDFLGAPMLFWINPNCILPCQIVSRRVEEGDSVISEDKESDISNEPRGEFDPEKVNSISFWAHVMKSKLKSGFYLPETFQIEPRYDWYGDYDRSIPTDCFFGFQKRDQCFAHCNWGFFRFFILRHAARYLNEDPPKAARRSRYLEARIKEFIVKHNKSTNEALRAFVSEKVKLPSPI